MVDKYATALFTPREAAHYLRMPRSTLYGWLRPADSTTVLVHSVPAERHGWPSVPFIGLVEAYVLRNLRDLGLSTKAIRGAALRVREEFRTPYGLATRRIATDGIDIFIHYAQEDELARASDGQRPIRAVIEDYLRYIDWDIRDGAARRLRLPQFPATAPVMIDPDYAFGQPVLADRKVPVEAVVRLWRAGERMSTVAAEYELDRETVEDLCRAAA
jgi:uncharacterized protein (DUF433 family)